MTHHPQLRDAASIVGIGHTKYSRSSGVSVLALAVEAIQNAVRDAGLSIDDIDGIATHHVNDSPAPHQVAAALGLDAVSWYHEEFGGGSKAPSVVGLAAMACQSSIAKHVVVYRALNGRSGARMGGSGGTVNVPITDVHFQRPYGIVAASQMYAMCAQAHMAAYGTSNEALGTVAVVQRAQAVDNMRAVMREPITLDDYFDSRPITEPFRLLDCCLETDGACAMVVTTTERARDLPHPVVSLSGWAWGIGKNGFWSGADELHVPSGPRRVAPRLYSMAGVTPGEIDVVEMYDAFTIAVLLQLEGYGFCEPGESGEFVLSGATARGGQLPVNTHGGLLSEGYIHGMNHIYEAVSQLRHTAGDRQVDNAEVAMSTGQPGAITGMSSALIMRRL